MPRVDLLLLGRPTLLIDGQPVAGLSFVKAQALLFYLALESDRPLSREAVAALLWPELAPAAARTNLRQVLAQLKAAVPAPGSPDPLVTSTPEAVQLNRAYALRVDVWAFQSRLDQVARHGHSDSLRCAVCARWRRWALELYRGPFLDQFFVHDSAAFDDWASLQRETLHEAAADALQRLAAYFVERGAARDAATTLERLLALDPWREEACRQLMLVLAATGQRSAALRQYRRCAAVLRAEFGADPDAETTLLYRRISAGADLQDLAPALLAADTRFPTNLRAPTTTFVGRAGEVQAVCALLRDGGERLITITGPPGIGKSRLALAVSHALRTEYDDGVWWVSLLDVREVSMLVAAIARALGVSQAGAEEPLAALQRALRDRLLLLVLDNCEQLATAAPLLSTLLATCPHLALVTTSRVPLRIQGEVEYLVPALGMPAAGTVPPPEELEHYDAIKLFLDRARAVRSEIAPSAETAGTLVAICRRLDGLALAIELAAARVKLFSLPALLTQLSCRLDVLVGGARDLPRHQQTMRSAITWSYELLPPAEQRLFRRLGVFAGGWTVEAARAVCAGLDPALPILDGLQALLDQHLVHRLPDDHDLRFGMLETIREYALDQLAAAGEAELASQRHAACCLGLATAAAPQLKGPAQGRWITRLEAEHDNLRLAVRWSLSADQADTAQRLVAALWWFWRLRGYFQEGRSWVEQALAAGPERLVPEHGALLMAAGLFAFDAGDHAAARRWFEAKQALAEHAQSRADRADALFGLGMLDVFGGTQAPTRLEQALALYRDLDDPWGSARVLQRLTAIAVDRGEAALAARSADESLRLARQTANPWLVAWSLLARGNLAVQHGDAARGMAAFAESAALFEACADRAGIAHARLRMAMAALAQGRYADATGLLVDCRRVFAELGLEEFIATALVFGGYAALYAQDVGRGKAQLQDSMRRYLQLAHAEGIGASLIGLAWVALLEGRAEDGAEVLGAAAALRERSGARLRPVNQRVYEHVCAALHARLDDAAFGAAWARGRALPRATALAQAVGDAAEAV